MIGSEHFKIDFRGIWSTSYNLTACIYEIRSIPATKILCNAQEKNYVRRPVFEAYTLFSRCLYLKEEISCLTCVPQKALPL